MARWTDSGIPQIVRFPVADCEYRLSLPDTMQENDPEFLTALRDAVESGHFG